MQSTGAIRQAEPRPRSGRAGFTLIELLIVIAILSLLMSILIPALTRAKELARRAKCSAGLHGWGLRMHTYVTDFNGWFPWMQTGSTAYMLIDQAGRGGGYGPDDPRDFDDSRVKHFHLLGYVESEEHLNCPCATKVTGRIMPDGTIRWLGYFQVGVGTDLSPKRDSNLGEPSQWPFISDNLWMPADSSAPSEGTSNYRWSNHNPGDPQGANCVYADGHVEWLDDLRAMWWGPFSGYITPYRSLVPPNSTACYTYFPDLQPVPW